jgi:hypothetical protein
MPPVKENILLMVRPKTTTEFTPALPERRLHCRHHHHHQGIAAARAATAMSFRRPPRIVKPEEL